MSDYQGFAWFFFCFQWSAWDPNLIYKSLIISLIWGIIFLILRFHLVTVSALYLGLTNNSVIFKCKDTKKIGNIKD